MSSVFFPHHIGGRDWSRLAETIMLPLGPPSLIYIITCILVTFIGYVMLFQENLDMQLDRRGGLGPGGCGELIVKTLHR